MRKLNFIYRFYLNKKALVAFLVISAVFSILIALGRQVTLDSLVYAFSPPIELVFFAITILFLFALKNHNYELLTSLLSAFLVLLFVWPLYFLMIINFPPVITKLDSGELTGFFFLFAITLICTIYFIIIHILCSKKRNLNKVIRFNSVLCAFLSLLFIGFFVYAYFIADNYIITVFSTLSFDQMLKELSYLLFFVPLFLVYICSFNIVVSLQTINYLINRGLLDEYI